jgi:hypothetical protein
MVQRFSSTKGEDRCFALRTLIADNRDLNNLLEANVVGLGTLSDKRS